jgi:large subunit ribosomal protein L10
MPNQKVLSEKQAIVAELAGKLNCAAGVLVDYSGITVAEDTEMRARLRKENVDYSVVKNTLLRFAAKNTGYDGLDPILNGTTALAVHTTDPVAPARILKEYASKLVNHFEIKGGFMNGKVLSVDEVIALASIPALPVLQAQLLGTMLAPIASLAVVLKAAAEKLGGGPIDDAETAETAVTAE